MTLALFDEGLADDTALSTVVGAAWFLVMLAVVLGGARLTVRAQLIMSGVELAILALFAVLAVFHTDTSLPFDWSWLGFSHFDGVSGFAAGALVAAFYYWGWDVTSNLSEETRDSRRTTGLAGLIGVGIVFLLFEVFTIAVNVVLSSQQIENNGANVLAALGEEVWPGWGGKVLVVAVLLSTVATLETTLIQVTRSLFAMGRDRTMPSALGRVHRTWNTPWVAIAVVGGVALVLFVASNALGSVGDILADAISAIGLQIAVYYGLAGLAAVVAYRKTLLKSPADFLLGGLWPLFGAAFMFWILVESLGELAPAAVAIGIGGLAVGLVPMLWYWRQGSDYYRPARLDASRTVEADYVPEGRPATHAMRPRGSLHRLLRGAPMARDRFAPDFDPDCGDAPLSSTRHDIVIGRWQGLRDLLRATGPAWLARGHRVRLLAQACVEAVRRWRPGWPPSRTAPTRWCCGRPRRRPGRSTWRSPRAVVCRSTRPGSTPRCCRACPPPRRTWTTRRPGPP